MTVLLVILIIINAIFVSGLVFIAYSIYRVKIEFDRVNDVVASELDKYKDNLKYN